MFLISITSLLWKQVDQLFIFSNTFRRLWKLYVGHYFMFCLILIAAPITQAYFPRLVDLIARNKNTDLVENYRLMSQMIVVLIGSAAFLLCFYSSDIVYLWTSNIEIAQEIGLIVILLSLSSLIISMLYSPYNFLIAKGITKPVLLINITGLIFILPSIFILVPIYGVVGIIIVKLMIDLIRFLVYSVIIRNHFKSLRILTILKDNTILS